MSFKVKCENCDNALDKVFDALSIYRGIMSGGIVECKNCKARYKSKYKTSFFEGLVPLDIVVLPIYIWLLLYFDDWAISLIACIVVYQCFTLVVHILCHCVGLIKVMRNFGILNKKIKEILCKYNISLNKKL